MFSMKLFARRIFSLKSIGRVAAFAALALLELGAVNTTAFAEPVNPQFYYRLTTQFRGDQMCLDVYNGGGKNNMTHLDRCADLSGQYWSIQPAGNGYYRLTTMFRGAGMCLDVFNGGPQDNQPHLAPCANYSGQFWSIVDQGGWNRLTTQFRGSGMCLDIFNGGPDNNMPHLTPCADFSGQFWRLIRTDKRV